MIGTTIDDLGELQRQVLEVVWDLGRASVHQVRDRLARDRDLAYTTVLTTLQKLEKRGLLAHERQGKVYVYVPRQSREEAGGHTVSRLIRRVFHGKAMTMLQHLVQEDHLSDEELLELRKMIDVKREERRHAHESSGR